MSALDVLDAAVQAAEAAGNFYGKLDVDGQEVFLKKGEKKRAFMPGDDPGSKQIELTLRLNPLDCSGLTELIERQMIANWGEWSRIVWPSLRDLGVKSLHDIRGKWAKVTLVKNGDSYTNKSGQVVEKTTFKFLAIYQTEAEAVAAWESQFGGSQPTQSQAQPAANDAERAVAAQFLPALVKAANGDLTALAANLASFDLTKKYFDVNSPEVQQLLKAT